MSTALDINNFPDLKRLVKEAKKTGTQYVLRENNHDLAVLTPVDTAKTHKTKQQAIEETLAFAGAWKDLPSEHMEEELDSIRHASKPTPPLELDL